MAFVVVTDSASNLNRELLEKYDIDMVSFHYSYDGKEFPCFSNEYSFNEGAKKYYDLLRKGKVIKTSLIGIQDYIECFEKHLKEGKDVLYISISSKLSGTLNSSMNARDILLDEYPERKIVCLDSLNASFGEAQVAIMASQARDKGLDIEQTVNLISPLRLNIRSEFVVDKLTYLARTGRVNPLIASIGNFLDIKALLRASKDAKIESSGKVRGRRKSLIKLAEIVQQTIVDPEIQILYLAHCDVEDEANYLASLIKEKIPSLKEIYIEQYDLCSGAHVGPGAIAVFYYGVSREKK